VIDLGTIKTAAMEVAKTNGARFALLFGSFARGTETKHSDVDLIFVEETSDRYLDRIDRYLKPLTERLDPAVEIFVYTPSEFESMKEGPFVARALREGVVLFESGEAPGRFAPLASAGEG